MLDEAEIIDDEEPDFEAIQRNKAQYQLRKLNNQNEDSIGPSKSKQMTGNIDDMVDPMVSEPVS